MSQHKYSSVIGAHVTKLVIHFISRLQKTTWSRMRTRASSRKARKASSTHFAFTEVALFTLLPNLRHWTVQVVQHSKRTILRQEIITKSKNYNRRAFFQSATTSEIQIHNWSIHYHSKSNIFRSPNSFPSITQISEKKPTYYEAIYTVIDFYTSTIVFVFCSAHLHPDKCLNWNWMIKGSWGGRRNLTILFL